MHGFTEHHRLVIDHLTEQQLMLSGQEELTNRVEPFVVVVYRDTHLDAQSLPTSWCSDKSSGQESWPLCNSREIRQHQFVPYLSI
jgi:hypothetical protein